MRALLIVLSGLVIATAAAGQVVPQATAVAGNVFAGAAFAQPLLPGTHVWPGCARSALAGTDSASLLVLHDLDTVRVDVHWQLTAQAVTSGTCTAGGEVLYELWSPVPQIGRLIVDHVPSATGTGQHTLAIDLFDDGSIDAQGSVVIPVVFGPQSLLVRVQAEVTAQAGAVSGPWGSSWSWNGAASVDLSLRFEASHASAVTLQASGCSPAASLVAQPNFAQGVDLTVAAPIGDELALFVLGLAPQSTPVALPTSALPGCSLLVVPIVAPWLPLDPAGLATLAVPVPPAVRPAALLAQAIAVDLESLRLTGSPALRVDVP